MTRTLKAERIAEAEELIQSILRAGLTVEGVMGCGSADERVYGHWLTRIELACEIEISRHHTRSGNTETIAFDSSWFDA